MKNVFSIRTNQDLEILSTTKVLSRLTHFLSSYIGLAQPGPDSSRGDIGARLGARTTRGPAPQKK